MKDKFCCAPRPDEESALHQCECCHARSREETAGAVPLLGSELEGCCCFLCDPTCGVPTCAAQLRSWSQPMVAAIQRVIWHRLISKAREWERIVGQRPGILGALLGRLSSIFIEPWRWRLLASRIFIEPWPMEPSVNIVISNGHLPEKKTRLFCKACAMLASGCEFSARLHVPIPAGLTLFGAQVSPTCVRVVE